MGPAPNHPRDSARVLTRHRTVLITPHITWQRVSSAPPVPAQMHDSLSTEEGESEADDERTSDRGGGGVVDELDDGLAHLNDLDVPWGFDLKAVCKSAHNRHLPPATLATVQSRRWIRLRRVRWTPPWPRQAGPKQSRRWVRLKGVRWTPPRSRQGGLKGTRAHQQPPAQTNGKAKSPRGPVGADSTRAQQLGTAPRESKGPDPESEPTPER